MLYKKKYRELKSESDNLGLYTGRFAKGDLVLILKLMRVFSYIL